MITSESLSDISAVPLFIKLPGQQLGQKISSQAALIDIFPTIVDALGISLDWQWAGSSLLDDKRGENESITVKKTNGSVITYPAVQHLQHLAMRAAQFEAVLGRGTEPGFFSIGKHSALIGTRKTSILCDVTSRTMTR